MQLHTCIIHMYLNDSTEPACIADVLQAHWVVPLSLSLVRVERVDRDASEGETQLLQGTLTLSQTGLQSPATREREREGGGGGGG